MNDADRLFAYAERFFQRHGRTEFPTVAHAARALHWRQARVEAAIEDDGNGRLMLTSYNVEPAPRLGEHFVETLLDDKGN